MLHVHIYLAPISAVTNFNLEQILFANVFTSARMIGGPYLTYVTLSADNPLLIKAVSLSSESLIYPSTVHCYHALRPWRD